MAKPLHALDYLEQKRKAAPPPVVVVFGDEAFLKRLVLADLRQQVLGADEGDFSLSVFQGDKLEVREVFDELATLAMFGGGQRLVIVEQADDFVSKNRSALEDYVAKPRGSSVLALEVASWPSNTRLAKSLADTGLAIECKPPAEARLHKWLLSWSQAKHAAPIVAAAGERLLEIVGPEMGLLDQELAKLALLAGQGGKITLELVEEAVAGWRAKTAWDMLDAAADGDAPAALDQLDRLLLAGESPIALLGQIGATLRRYAAAARLVEQAETAGRRANLNQALEEAGVETWPAIMNKAVNQLRQLGRQRAGQLYHWLLEADLALKGVSSAPARARLVLEQLIVRMSGQLAKTTGR